MKEKIISANIPGCLDLEDESRSSLSQAERDTVFVLLRKAGFTTVEFGGDSKEFSLVLGHVELSVEEE
jgi:hypothetical protein